MNHKEKSFGRFLILWSGEFLSAIGSGLTSFGLGVYVYQQTGKATAMALVTLLAFMPSLLLSAAAGVLADRYDRRLLMVLGDSLSIAGLAFILICVQSGGAQLWQICVGVTVSSVFSSLLDPAYKATITDLLTREQFTKASGLVQVAGSAKYLISPAMAGALLAVSDLRLLLIIDICTFLVAAVTTLAVRRGLASRGIGRQNSFLHELKEGWRGITERRGVLVLVILTSLITFFIGFLQMLFTPMILAFTDSSTLGYCETIAASGMLVTSVVLGFLPIKGSYVKVLSAALFCSGISMAAFGLRENLILISASGFLFFASLPFANTSIDFLIRTNIENSVQGRAWGLISVISQSGYVAAYALSGVLADYVFTPLLQSGGPLAGSLGTMFGTGAGRGTGLLISTAGALVCIFSVILYHVNAVKTLEQGGEPLASQIHPL